MTEVTERYELLTATDARELYAGIEIAEARFVRLVRAVSPDLRLANSTWTTRDVVGHIVTVVRRYTRRDPTRSEGLADTPREVDRLNEDELQELAGIPCERLLLDLREELDLVRQMWPVTEVDLHQMLPFHGGVVVDTAAGLSNLIGELLIHGLDIAKAAGLPWPIDPRDAVLMLNGLMQIGPAYAKRSATHELALQLRIPGATPWVLDFAGGSLTSRRAAPNDRPDVILRAPSVTLMLALYQRISTSQAMMNGLFVVGGRRPWRIRHFNGLLEEP